MITEPEIDAAIAECVGKRNPDANTVRTLAALYTIKEHLYPSEQFGKSEQLNATSNYSFAPPPDQKPDEIVIDSDSEFARVIAGRKQEEVWPVMDELMDALKQLYPKLYNAVMDRL